MLIIDISLSKTFFELPKILRWMQYPDPESVARYRNNQSLNSHGSDDSLASLLEKVDGYNSEEDNKVCLK